MKIRTSNISDVHLQDLYEKIIFALKFEDYDGLRLVLLEFFKRQINDKSIEIRYENEKLTIMTPYDQLQINPLITAQLNLENNLIS